MFAQHDLGKTPLPIAPTFLVALVLMSGCIAYSVVDAMAASLERIEFEGAS
jgi:cephalosporin-C deacetylase-like acetyl esterase